MRHTLRIAAELDGQLWRYRPAQGLQRHRHRELELEHVIRGEATLLVGDQRLQLEPRSLVWLFPGQEHVVVESSDDFEMWIACFRRRLVRRCCVSTRTRPLRVRQKSASLCRRLGVQPARRLCSLLAEVSAYGDASTYNAGLGHLLLHAWLQFEQAEGG